MGVASPVQVGWIPYLNLHPLRQELLRRTGSALELKCGHPTMVNRWLAEGSVQLAPASSFALLKSERTDLAFPLGIASRGAVHSVYLGLNRSHEAFFEFVKQRQLNLGHRFRQILEASSGDVSETARSFWLSTKGEITSIEVPRLIFTPASAASAALTKILLNIWCGESVATKILARSSVEDGGNASGESDEAMKLIIGDEALVRRPEFWQVLDLGQVWWELTGLPFVFGLWQSTHKPSQMLKDIILDAATLVESRMSLEPCVYFPKNIPLRVDGSSVDLAAYWKSIYYRLSETEMRSLLLYFSMYLEIYPQFLGGFQQARMVRWKQLWLEPRI